jgi:hypothetical protein
MAVYILTVANGVSQANRTANLKKAYYVADAGLADAYERITQAGKIFVPPPSGQSYIPSPATDNGVYAAGTATGNYNVTVAITNTPGFNYTITSTGTFGNETKTLQLKMTWASISKYAYWSQTENSPIYGKLWWVGIGVPNAPGSFVYVTTGPVQTNGTLNLFGNPIFNGAVTEANGDGPGSGPGPTPYYYYGSSNTANPYGLVSNPNEIFPDGITSDAPKITVPPQTTLNLLNAEAADGSGLVLTGNSTVIFNPQGTITVTGNVVNSNCQTTTPYKNTTISPPANGVIYVQSSSTIPACKSSALDGNATVQGTVSGQLTVVADQNIYISGNVAYNEDPRPTPANPAGHPNSMDLLALVANQNITVIQASAFAQDGPSLELSAVMVALQGSFQVDQWWVYMGPAGPPGNPNAAIMDQFGSLINYVCGATGEIDLSGNLLGGWNQQQSYDARLAKMSPPGFTPLVNSSGNITYSRLNIQECVSGVCG